MEADYAVSVSGQWTRWLFFFLTEFNLHDIKLPKILFHLLIFKAFLEKILKIIKVTRCFTLYRTHSKRFQKVWMTIIKSHLRI